MGQNNRGYTYFVIVTFGFAFAATQLVDMEKLNSPALEKAATSVETPFDWSQYLAKQSLDPLQEMLAVNSSLYNPKTTKKAEVNHTHVATKASAQKQQVKTTFTKHGHAQATKVWLKKIIEKNSHYLEDEEVDIA